MTMADAEKVWRDNATSPAPELTAKDLDTIRAEARSFNRTTSFRDAREWAASLFMIGMYGWIALQPGSPRLALVIAAVFLLVPVCYLTGYRLMKPSRAASPTGPMRKHLTDASQELRRQQWLLERVGWWYLLPLAASTMVFLVGTARAIPKAPLVVQAWLVLGGSAICAGVFFWVWRLNRRVAKEQLGPRAARLEQLAASLA